MDIDAYMTNPQRQKQNDSIKSPNNAWDHRGQRLGALKFEELDTTNSGGTLIL
jgi:hypothetical protein